MNRKKTITRILFFGILLGILMFIIGNLFHLPKKTIYSILLISYIIFIAIVIPYQIRKVSLLNHKIEILLQKMYQGEIENYILEMGKILEHTDNDYLKSVLIINRSIGYTLKGEFKTSNDYLERIDKNSINKASQTILYHNIALNYFLLGETKKACTIMELHKEILQKGLELYPDSFSETFALWAFAKEEKEQGFTYLKNVMNSKTAKPSEKQAVSLIWAKQKILDNEITEAKNILQNIVSESHIPYLKKEAENILERLKQ